MKKLCREPGLAVLVLAVMLVGGAMQADAETADARVVRRSTDQSTPEVIPGRPHEMNWAFRFGAGMSAGGDLFLAKSGANAPWTAPLTGETFTAKRFTVTLDENVGLSVALARRISRRGWLHLGYDWTEMDATALANDTQYVELVPYDVLTFSRFQLVWEERLTETPLTPVLLVGATWLSVSASADDLDKSRIAPVVGMGLLWHMPGPWSVRLDLVDTIVQLSSDETITEDGPEDAEFIEFGPQHLVGIELGLMFVF